MSKPILIIIVHVKELRVQVRISEELRRRIDAAEKITHIKESVFMTACLEAYCDYVEKHGEITFPLVVKPARAEKAPPQISGFKSSQKKSQITASS